MNENTSYQILLVEDNLVDRRLLRILLLNVSNFDIELIYVKTLAEAIAHLERIRFDAILLDLFLPDSRGLDTLTRLKKESLTRRQNTLEMPQLEQWQTLPPIIVLTGLEDEETALKAIQVGAQDYLLKGELSSRLLIRTLHYSIERSKIEELLRQASEELDAELNRRTANLQISLRELEKEIARRKQAENQLRQDQENLEALVQERTAELEARNQQLRQEIDRRQESEAALRESERRYRSVIEGSQEIIFQSDRDGNWLFLNPAWQGILGYDVAETLGRSVFEFIHPSDRPEAFKQFSQLINTESNTYHGQMKWIHADGSIRWLEGFVHARLTEDGEIGETSGTFRDVTDRQQSQEQLKLYREIVANANDAIAIIDPAGYYLEQNRAHAHLMGYTTEELQGETPSIHLGNETFGAIAGKLAETGIYRGEVISRTKAGKVHDLDISAFTIRDESGEPTCYVGIQRDISDRKNIERELRFTQFAVDSAAEIIIWVNDRGQFVRVNEAACAIGGHSPAELLTLRIFDLDPNFNRESWPEFWQQIQQQKSLTLESCWRNQTGALIPMEILANYIEFDGQEYICAFIRDIRDRINAQIVLQDSEERFRHTFEQAAVGIAQVSPDGTFARVNQKLCQMLGYTAEELLQVNFRDITYPEDFEVSVERVNELLRRERNTYSLEKRYLHKDGSPVWINLTVSLVWTPAGTPKHFVSIFQDISDRKEAEIKLQETTAAKQEVQAELDRIMESLEDIVWSCDAKTWQLTYVNAAVEKIFGHTGEEFMADSNLWIERIHPDDRQKAETETQILLTVGDRQIEYRILRLDGTIRWISYHARVTYDETGEPLRIDGITSDITARKVAEEALKRERALLRCLIDSIPDFIFYKDPQGAYLGCNVAFAKFLGRSEAEIIDRTDLELFSARDVAIVVRKHDLQILEAGCPQSHEEWAIYPDGTRRRLDTLKTPFMGTSGEVLGVIGISRDITDRQEAEEKLRQSEARNRALVQAIPDLLIRMNTNGDYLDVISGGEVELFKPNKIQNNANLYNILPFETAQEWMKCAQQALTTEKPQVYEYELVKGEKIWQEEVRIVPCAEDEVLAMVRDISDRKRAEMERDRFFTQSIDLLCIAGFDGYFKRVNPSWEATLGYTVAELMACPFIDFVHPSDRDATLEAAGQLAEGNNVVYFENRYQCKDGSYKWLAWNSTAFSQEGLIYAVAHDITEQKNYEANLERERRQLQQIVKNAPVAMAMFDRNMNYLAHSDRWLTDYELPNMPLVGWNYYDIFPDIPDRWREAHQRALQGEKLSNPEDIFRREDGQQFCLRWALHPWQESNDEIGGIVMVTDRIDELVQAREAALENVRLKSQFLANMSHEIRTPMNGVLGMTELLLNTTLDRQQLDFVQTLRSSGENLLTIINDILDFSKLEAGEMRLDPYEFHLNSAIEDLLDLFVLQSHEKGVELICIIERDVPRSLKGDAARLRQILTNLLSNALKFTQQGEVTLSVTCQEIDNNLSSVSNSPSDSGGEVRGRVATKTRLHFAVKDTGIGISVEGQKKLFQSFSQVDASDTRTYGGTGLGLAICKELVQLMGGEIGVESIPDRGSTFWFTAIFDSFNPQEEDNTLPRKETQTSIAALTGKKLLVVDDNATNRKIVRLQAKAWGMEVDEAENGTVALAILRLAVVLGRAYDLVLLDMQMPEMTGEMLGRQIRSEADIAQTRLIMMTSLDEGDLIDRLEKIGFDGYLLKPIVTSRLLNSLLDAIEAGPIQDISPSLSPVRPKDINRPISIIKGKILVVEDALVNQKVVLNQLQLLGYEADCANDGREALEQWDQGNYTLVFMDCQMPVMDGYQATQLIRQREEEDRHTIIVGLTAYAMKGDREKCLEAGMDDYLSKPVSKQDLSVMLAKWISASIAPSPPTSIPTPPVNPEESEGVKQLIDPEQFETITDGNRDFQRELLRSFIDDAEIDLLQAKQALEEKDSRTLGQKAHRIKGAAANLGITELSQITATLEQQAKEQKLIGMETLLDRVEGLLEEVKQFLLTIENEEQEMEKEDRRADPFAVSHATSLIDRKLLQSISGGDRDFEVELLSAFLTDIEAELQIAKAAFEAENYADLIQRGSSFKSAAESVAVGFIPNLAVELVKAASQQNREDVTLVLKELEQVLKRVKTELES